MAVELEFERKPKFLLDVQDSLIMIRRSTTHIIRHTDQLLGTFFQPIMFLVLFAAVFGGALEQSLPKGVSYINFLMAGIIIQTVAFGSTTTAIAVSSDLQKGIVDRFRSLPMNNLAVLTGHVVSDLARNGLSTLVMIITGLAIGFRTSASPWEWLQIIGLIGLFTLAFSWLASIIGVMAKSVEAVQWLTFIIIFPLTFASSAFTPTDNMGSVLRAFAQHQPITQFVNALRALLLGTPIGNYGWVSLAWGIGTLVVIVPFASWLFRRRGAN
ncbi:MAG: transporter permease [Candidatus Saccharibacteria bacterium]|nr:transporter permease [Candidatus Saccharibacteria bacterium]